MKRIFLTGMIAVALFATSAFAASFNVNQVAGSEEMADISSGATDVEACSDDVTVNLNYSQPSVGAPFEDWDIESVDVRTANFTCVDHEIQVALLGDGEVLGLTDIGVRVSSPNPVTLTLDVPGSIKVGDVDEVSVVINEPTQSFSFS